MRGRWIHGIAALVLVLLVVGSVLYLNGSSGSSEGKSAGAVMTGGVLQGVGSKPVSQEGAGATQIQGNRSIPVSAPAAVPTRTTIGTGVAPDPTPPRSGRVPSENSDLEHEMVPGESFKARAGSMVKGDVFVDGVRYFDDNENTGLIIELDKDATIFAKFGANVTFVGFEPAVRNAIFGQAVEEMKKKGCMPGRGCIEGVTIVPVPGGTPQGTSGGK